MPNSESRTGRLWIVIAWLATAAGSVFVIGEAVSGQHSWFGLARHDPAAGLYDALGIVLAIGVVIGLIGQLINRRIDGFVLRLSVVITGCVVIAAFTALLLIPFVVS